MSYSEPPPPPAPGYGAPPPGGAQHPRGTLILVLGILSLTLCGIFTAIPAVIMGKSALDESKTAHYANEGVIKGGYICGIISLALFAVAVVIWIIIGVGAAGS